MTSIIKKGSSGADVILCQQALNRKGYPLTVDGSFGPGTESKVKSFQEDSNLESDGIVGSKTWEILLREYNSCDADKKYIIHNGKPHRIAWDKVVLWNEPGGLKIKPGRYYDNTGKKERVPLMFVNHWDVCLSAASCTKILNERGVSVHFCLDNDGTIYQILDTQHGAWHCGKYGGNKKGIGIEISNGYYLKYQKHYVKQGFGERPIKKDAKVHGRTLDPFLDFYPIQLQALKALWLATSDVHNIPLNYPKNEDGSPCTTVHEGCEKGNFKGFCNHYNFTNRKIDCAGLDIPGLLEEVKALLPDED
tara:strand:- start:127 stop:1044 length:918 start_codon:yes stop_codon:yes gene_type:complete